KPSYNAPIGECKQGLAVTRRVDLCAPACRVRWRLMLLTDRARELQAYGTSVQRPQDFDEFWAAIMREAASVPLNPSIEHVPLRSTDEVDVFEIHYDSLDQLRIAGWYCVPKAAYLPPPYPAILIVPGYISEPTLPKAW